MVVGYSSQFFWTQKQLVLTKAAVLGLGRDCGLGVLRIGFDYIYSLKVRIDPVLLPIKSWISGIGILTVLFVGTLQSIICNLKFKCRLDTNVSLIGIEIGTKAQ